mgnify:CR=1 FL=1
MLKKTVYIIIVIVLMLNLTAIIITVYATAGLASGEYARLMGWAYRMYQIICISIGISVVNCLMAISLKLSKKIIAVIIILGCGSLISAYGTFYIMRAIVGFKIAP